MKNRYPEHIMKTLRKGLGLEADDTSRDNEINTYSPSEALDGMLNWEGIIGYTYTIKYWIESIYGIDLEKIQRIKVYDYFKKFITNKENWDGDETQNETTATMIHGALVFAEIFGLLTNDEQNELMCMEFDNKDNEED